MDTIDTIVLSSDGWTLIPIENNVSMVVYNNTSDTKTLFRIGSTTTSDGVNFKPDTPITVDEDLYVKALPGFNNKLKSAKITRIVTPA